jgi:hypothetical protein
MDGISTSNALKAVISGLTQGAPSADQIVMICNPDGTPNKQYPAQQLIQDMATAGNGYGSCSTPAATVAKTVAITNFILKKNGKVHVFFTTANDAAGATLNVNSTGAKPILVYGAAIQPGVIKARTIVEFQYDGTNWNIVNIFGLEQSQTPTAHVVDMGLPSGLKWADCDIDLTQADKFAASPFQYNKTFFSWGNTDGHNPISDSAFDYNWGGVNENAPYYEGQVYGDTPGNKLTASMAPSQDAARANLGGPWRMPTTAEFKELFDNCDYVEADGTTVIAAGTANKLVTVNGVVGIYLKSKINGNKLFFACSGDGYGTSWSNRGSSGLYWSASFYSARYAYSLYFGSGGVSAQNYNLRYSGFAVRPVQ